MKTADIGAGAIGTAAINNSPVRYLLRYLCLGDYFSSEFLQNLIPYSQLHVVTFCYIPEIHMKHKVYILKVSGIAL